MVGNKFHEADVMNTHITESHDYWVALMQGKVKKSKISRSQTSNKRWCKTFIPAKNTTAEFGIPKTANILPPAPRPAEFDKWYYLDSNFNVINVPA